MTPDLANHPSLAMDVAKSKDPVSLAPVISHTARTTAANDSINDHITDNNSDGFWQSLGHGVAKTGEWLGKPLKEVQRDYKFVHSVYANHGVLAGFAVTLGVIGGATAGAFLGGTVGATLGADAAATLLRKMSTVGPWKDTYRDSYHDSENALYKVSPGRDFSNALGTATDVVGWDSAAKAFRNTDAGIGKVVSGVGDTGFDLTADPIMVISKFGSAMRGGKLLKLDEAGIQQLKYPLYKAIPGAKNFILNHTGRALSSEQLDAVRNGSTKLFGGNQVARLYNRALEDIANSSAGEIVTKYASLGTEAAGHLGSIMTAEGVHNWLKSAHYFDELGGALAGGAALPRRTLLAATIDSQRVVTKIADSIENGLSKIPGVSAEMAKAAANGTADIAALPANAVKYLRNAENKIGAIYKTFTGYMPYSIDADTAKLSTSKFKWNARDAATVIYRIARFGMGDEGAKMAAGKYAEAVAAEEYQLARIIKNQTVFEAFKKMGLHDDNIFVQRVKSEIDKIDEGTISGQIYGGSPMGDALGTFQTAGGPRSAGIFAHHEANEFSIPNFNAVKASLRDAGNHAAQLGGKLDEWIADGYTNRIFKPLALATTGFGLRVAASEMLPTIARYGMIGTFKATLGKSAAKANYKLTKGEAEHVAAATFTALGANKGIAADAMTKGFPAFKEAKARGLTNAAKMLAPEQLELATRVILTNGGHIGGEAIRSGHNSANALQHEMDNSANYFYQVKKNNATFKDIPDYTMYSAENPYYLPLLQTSLSKASKDAAQKNIASDLVLNIKNGTKKLEFNPDTTNVLAHKEYLDLRDELIASEYRRMMETKAGQYAPYKAESKVLDRWRIGDTYQFATDRVDATLGKLIGQDGTYQSALAKKVAAGESIDMQELVSIYGKGPMSLPKQVEGQIMMTPPTKGWFNAIIDKTFKSVVDPIINNLSRETMYILHVADEIAPFNAMVLKGTITDDQALRFAQQRAVYTMIPQIHNVALRSQFAQLARNFLPFYFAQEQALKRAAAAIKDTSAGNIAFSRGLRYYQIAEQSLNDPAFVQTDDRGNRYVTLPGIGAFGSAMQSAINLITPWNPMVANLPMSVEGNLSSLRTVLPELAPPGTTPFVSLGANALAKFFPATRSFIGPALGDIAYHPNKFGVDATIDALIPATWAKNVFRALTLDDQDAAVKNAIAGALASAYYHEQIPGQKDGVEPDAVQMRRFVNNIKWNVRSILMIKAALNILSPLAPKVTQEDMGFRNEFWNLVKEKGKGNYADALQTFIERHGDKAISYTIGASESTIDGLKYPYVKATTDYMRNNADKLSDPSVSLAYYNLIPQKMEQGNSYETFAELVSMDMRKDVLPADLIRKFYIAQGDYAISTARKEHYDKLNKAKANFDTFSVQQINKDWANTMKDMKVFFPEWYDDNMNGKAQANAQKVIDQLNTVFASPNPPTHDQAKLVKGILDKYNTYKGSINTYSSLQVTGFLPSQTKKDWEDYLYKTSQETPELAPIIYGVFNKLGN
jgi:hypothetical protein